MNRVSLILTVRRGIIYNAEMSKHKNEIGQIGEITEIQTNYIP